MIDLQLPEPPVRQCCMCFRECGTQDGILIHWPHAHAIQRFSLIDGSEIEPFSLWVYRCRFHRGVETRRRKREEAAR